MIDTWPSGYLNIFQLWA